MMLVSLELTMELFVIESMSTADADYGAPFSFAAPWMDLRMFWCCRIRSEISRLVLLIWLRVFISFWYA